MKLPTLTCLRCDHTWHPRIEGKPVKCPHCQSPYWGRERQTPADNIEAARRHHEMHGDMDGKTCLLNKCALHYPRQEKGD